MRTKPVEGSEESLPPPRPIFRKFQGIGVNGGSQTPVWIFPIIFAPAILGPEMAAPILWGLAFFGLSAGKQSMFYWGGGIWGAVGGGGSANFIFMGVGIKGSRRFFVDGSVAKVSCKGS